MDLGKNWEVIFSAGGFIWFVTLDGKIFLHTYDKGMEGVRRSFEKVYKHLNKGGLFLVNIQHQGWNHRQPLKSGREFSFEITKKTPTRVFKHHKIHDNGSLVFERKFPLRMFSEKKADEAAENSGFKVLGPDPTNSFYVFEK